jgi:hypothetical protein
LLKLGKWRVTLNMMLAYFVFMGTWLLAEPLNMALALGFSLFAWDWPIFILYNLFFVQFGCFLVSGMRKSRSCLLGWHFLFFLFFFVYVEIFLRSEGGDIFTICLAEAPSVAGEYPLIFFRRCLPC